MADKNEIPGYGIIHKENGGVLQLGINQSYRNRNIEEQLMGQLKENSESKELKILNIEAETNLSQ